MADLRSRGLILLAGVLVLVVAGFLVANFASASSSTTTLPVAYEPTVKPAPAVPAPASPSRRTAAAGSAASTGSTVSQTWVHAMAAKAGIPETAMDAYARAEVSAPCQVGWTTLAGIGWVESQNGTIGDRTLLPSGRPSSPIYGPKLKGALDRAYGPMQIIPSTWREYATDGDDDGRTDPQDIFDATATAARYLCATDQDLATASGWASAVFSYNHSQAYVNEVYAAATAYDQRTR